MHIVLVDAGRTKLVGSDMQEMLRCIRCGACMNHCPVYQNVGGHAYGWVYPGPMGSVLTPVYVGIENAGDLPNAATFCGECAVVCPVKIPLPDLMRKLREKQFDRQAAALGRSASGSRAGASPRAARGSTRSLTKVGGARRLVAGRARAARSTRCRGSTAGRRGATCRRRRGETFRELYKRKSLERR